MTAVPAPATKRKPLTTRRARQARRRATYIETGPRMIHLPITGIIAGGVGIASLTLSVIGLAAFL